MSESYHWWDFLPQLQKRFPHDSLHTADILGNGPFFNKRTPLSVGRNIQALREQVPSEGKKILFGFSLGGMLALEWAHRHPDEVDSLILVNCSLNNSAFYKRITPSSLYHIFRSGLESDTQKREEAILRMTTAQLPRERISEIAQDWGRRGKEHPVRPTNFLWQLGVATLIPQRKEPPAPVLILSSGKDRVVHPDCSRKIARNWNVPLNFHPDAGHDLTLDDPQWVLQHVEQFVSSGKKS